jgi:hypothetical protein
MVHEVFSRDLPQKKNHIISQKDWNKFMKAIFNPVFKLGDTTNALPEGDLGSLGGQPTLS